jgi:acetate kinase
MLVLAVNSGSSSLKCAVIDPETERVELSAAIDSVGTEQSQLKVQTSAGSHTRKVRAIDQSEALALVLSEFEQQPDVWRRLGAVGHRVVHGGERFTSSVLIDDDVVHAIHDCAVLAPLHNPANLLGIRAAQVSLPHVPHVAVFDTAFHQTLGEVAYRYAVPTTWYKEHQIRRYGFHGTSHRFVARKSAQVLGRPLEGLNLLTAHLGNGCSASAIVGGKCVDTTMGFTPLEGLVMGTRSGDVDPSIIFHLVNHVGMDLRDVERALNRESGLLGLSGMTNDMRQLEQAYEGDPGARLAVEVFVHRLAKSLGALATRLPRLDAITFTGGIGEHSAFIRAKVCNQLAVLGVDLDSNENGRHGAVISTRESRVNVLVVATNEELLIAQDTRDLVNSRSPI